MPRKKEILEHLIEMDIQVLTDSLRNRNKTQIELDFIKSKLRSREAMLEFLVSERADQLRQSLKYPIEVLREYSRANLLNEGEHDIVKNYVTIDSEFKKLEQVLLLNDVMITEINHRLQTRKLLLQKEIAVMTSSMPHCQN